MRPAVRLLARFLEPGAPTGLTGLATHPAPRSTLIYLYSSTLSKLQAIPSHSPYRQATEALTKKRLAAVEAVIPEGLEQWESRVKESLAKHHVEQARKNDILPENAQLKIDKLVQEHQNDPAKVKQEVDKIVKEHKQSVAASDKAAQGLQYGGREFIFADFSPADIEWERPKGAPNEAKPPANPRGIRLEPEPRLTREQIGQLENTIGAGLIEEVIQVAEGENKLVDTLVESKVWESLEEPAPEGQWAYNERNTHTATTQKP